MLEDLGRATENIISNEIIRKATGCTPQEEQRYITGSAFKPPWLVAGFSIKYQRWQLLIVTSSTKHDVIK